jgi:hypothetical protein
MMVEIDIEELFAGSMNNMAPVLPVVYGAGEMTVFDWPEFESFTSTGIAERLVYRLGECKEFDIDDFWESMDGEAGVVIRDAVNAGIAVEILLGAKLGLPGDTLRILDFEENAKTNIVNIVNGLVKSWVVHEDGSLPTAAQTHEIEVVNGLIKTWNISVGGIRTHHDHTVETLKGLVKSWTAV